MSQSSAMSPDQNRRGHRGRTRVASPAAAKPSRKGNRAERRALGLYPTAARGLHRRAYPMPVHPTVISAAIRAAHTEAGATDDQLRAVRRHVDRLEMTS